ncbi:hypothetical protein [Amycolatopsis thermoflava]|uniref:hypothetical protein n=1 Tax=Amycolatopsis thermoflava TaxID=84480 RepID=UPI0038103840
MSQSSTETQALVKALAAMTANLPIAALELREGRMSRQRQQGLAALLVELGEFVRRHAGLSDPPDAPVRPTRHLSDHREEPPCTT